MHVTSFTLNHIKASSIKKYFSVATMLVAGLKVVGWQIIGMMPATIWHVSF